MKQRIPCLLLLLCSCFTSGIGYMLAQNKFRKSKACAAYFQKDDTSSILRHNAFINARYELSLVDSDIEWNNIFSQRMKRRINNFFNANVSSCVYMVNKKPVWYVTIFKAANNNIRGNLQVFSGTPKDEVNVKGFCPYWTPQQVQQRLNTEGGDLELDLDKQRYPHSRVDRPQSWSFRGTSTPSFTFVREPLGHFISGLSEAYYRSRNERYNRRRFRNRKWTLHPALSTVEIVKNLIIDQLRGRQKLFEREHYFPMAGVFHLWSEISFIGHLEHFSRDWALVNDLYDTDMTPHDPTLGEHVTSHSPNGIRESTQRLLRDNPAFQRALCHLYIVDYTCFDYPLPEVCVGITVPYSLGCKNTTVLSTALGVSISDRNSNGDGDGKGTGKSTFQNEAEIIKVVQMVSC